MPGSSAVDGQAWVARVLGNWEKDYDTHRQMAAGIWESTPGGNLLSKLSVLMLELPDQHQHNGGYCYVRYNDVLSLVAALDVDRKVLSDRRPLGDEYAVVYDGVPRMDGSHERCQIGRFDSLEAARAGFAVVVARSERAPKPGLRIEHRRVGPWTLIDGGKDG